MGEEFKGTWGQDNCLGDGKQKSVQTEGRDDFHWRKDMVVTAKGLYGSPRESAEREVWDKGGFTEMMARRPEVRTKCFRKQENGGKKNPLER